MTSTEREKWAAAVDEPFVETYIAIGTGVDLTVIKSFLVGSDAELKEEDENYVPSRQSMLLSAPGMFHLTIVVSIEDF